MPLLPWAAPLLLGALAARSAWVRQQLAGSAPQALVRLGRWPLLFYLLHQPLLLAFLALYRAVAA